MIQNTSTDTSPHSSSFIHHAHGPQPPTRPSSRRWRARPRCARGPSAGVVRAHEARTKPGQSAHEARTKRARSPDEARTKPGRSLSSPRPAGREAPPRSRAPPPPRRAAARGPPRRAHARRRSRAARQPTPPPSAGGMQPGRGTRRVRLVRWEGRDVSGQYGGRGVRGGRGGRACARA